MVSRWRRSRSVWGLVSFHSSITSVYKKVVINPKINFKKFIYTKLKGENLLCD